MRKGPAGSTCFSTSPSLTPVGPPSWRDRGRSCCIQTWLGLDFTTTAEDESCSTQDGSEQQANQALSDAVVAGCSGNTTVSDVTIVGSGVNGPRSAADAKPTAVMRLTRIPATSLVRTPLPPTGPATPRARSGDTGTPSFAPGMANRSDGATTRMSHAGDKLIARHLSQLV